MNSVKSEQDYIPRVVKLSGGRSSAMMLMNMLDRGDLNAKRGDVVVFNNTSAEHPKTYKFVKELKVRAEKNNIPFFWVEFCTFEDLGKFGLYQRYPTYRMVNSEPYSDTNTNGYKSDGSVFEELISFSGFLPNLMARVCTKYMKIFTTNSFLADWWGDEPGITKQGHNHKKSMITDEDVVIFHKKNKGEVPKHILLKKKEFVRNCSLNRDEQLWAHYTDVDIRLEFEHLRHYAYGGKVKLYGDDAVEFESYLGLRGDEKYRIKRVENRAKNSKVTSGTSYLTQPTNERIVTPLDNISKDEVLEFWSGKDFNLELDSSGLYSNCVYCPLKGKNKLIQIACESYLMPETATPVTMQWWVDIEKKYQRDVIEEERERTDSGRRNDIRYVGFFGSSKAPVYENLQHQVPEMLRTGKYKHLNDKDDNPFPCGCHD